MRGLIVKSWRQLAGNRAGEEIVEAALALPLLFVILIAIFWFGQAFRIYTTLTQAARQGARAAVAPLCATCTLSGFSSSQNAITAVSSALTTSNLNTSQLVPLSQWTQPSLCPCGSTSVSSCTSSVSCASYPTNSNVCVQPNVQLSFPAQGGAGECGTAVSFQYRYPYSFTLPCFPQPCSSLDLSKFTIPAQAQMRLETQ
jgi:Flp pilus assembly protein TadG